MYKDNINPFNLIELMLNYFDPKSGEVTVSFVRLSLFFYDDSSIELYYITIISYIF